MSGDEAEQLRQREAELVVRTRELAEVRRIQDEMLAMLVHDLKSPLAVIVASLDYALGSPEVGGEVREALEDCHEATERISRLVGTVLGTAQAEAGRLKVRRETIALPRLLDDALASRGPLLTRRGLAFEAELDGISINADRELMSRVVENLLDTAIRITPTGGRVKLWATAVDGAVELRVGTTGAAIPETSRALVFEKFTQVFDARGGVGLGMYFCRLAIEAHGGQIWIEESAIMPAVFALRLPSP